VDSITSFGWFNLKCIQTFQLNLDCVVQKIIGLYNSKYSEKKKTPSGGRKLTLTYRYWIGNKLIQMSL